MDQTQRASCSFPKSARILCPNEFTLALKGKRIAKGALFTLSVNFHTYGHARLGLIVAKRFAPRATTRNAIRRVCREAFRCQQAQLGSCDYVIRLHSSVPLLSLRQLKKQVRGEIDSHFARVNSRSLGKHYA